MRLRLIQVCKQAAAREHGQIMIMFAVFLIVLTVLAGSAFDYASIVVDDAQLQNAVDASLLAGSDSLSNNILQGPSAAKTAAVATTTFYLKKNGVDSATPGTTVNITFPTSTPVAGVATPTTPIPENIRIDAGRSHKTAFWPLVGINQVSMSGGGAAHAARGMIDVMLSLDTTNSMSQEFPALQDAVEEFVTAMNPNTSDPRSPRIGLARFQGESCTVNNNVYTNCHSDYTVLSPLTGDGATLKKLAANDPTNGACPVTALGNGSGYACPIGFHSPGSGTKLPNGIYAVNGANTDAPIVSVPYAWTTTNARNDNPAGSGWAKKILIMMTDGEDNDTYNRSGKDALWDSNIVSAAATLEAGPTSDPADDVEIYVVNFQCDASNTYTNGGCTSKLASRPMGNHLCPGPLPVSSTMSNTDTVLINTSSSSANTCDHYYPLRKDEDLPSLFLQLAGTISRGALTD